MHFLAESANGAFWSVCTHKLIKEVDSNNLVFSSASKQGGVAIADPRIAEEGQLQGESFITMDEPHHMPQRMAVAPTRRLKPA